MTAPDWFGVALRLLAAMSLFHGFQYLLSFIDAFAGWSTADNSYMAKESYLVYVIGYTALGIILFGNATLLTNLAYPKDADLADDESGS